jgi:hypothetical protein
MHEAPARFSVPQRVRFLADPSFTEKGAVKRKSYREIVPGKSSPSKEPAARETKLELVTEPSRHRTVLDFGSAPDKEEEKIN